MRLLQLTTIPETLEAFLIPFAEHFRNLGWAVDAGARAATQNTQCKASFDAVHDIDWSRNPLSSDNIRAYSQVQKLVERGSYDLVHVHTPVASFVTRAALRGSHRRPGLVYTAHGFHFHEGGNPVTNAVYLCLEKMAGPWADELVVINETDYRAAVDHKLIELGRLSHIPGIGFDIDAFRKRGAEGISPEKVRRSLGVTPDEALLMMVAEFTPNKRQIDAVEAFSRLGELKEEARLVFVGTGPESGTVQERAKQLALEGRVHFLGYRRDVPLLLAAADALLLVSEREGLPVSVLEAMALGVPVIGTDVRGTRDLIADGAGLVVPVRNPDAIARAMEKVVRRDTELEAVASLASEKLKGFSLATVLAAYEDVYERAAGKARNRTDSLT